MSSEYATSWEIWRPEGELAVHLPVLKRRKWNLLDIHDCHSGLAVFHPTLQDIAAALPHTLQGMEALKSSVIESQKIHLFTACIDGDIASPDDQDFWVVDNNAPEQI